MSSPSRSAVNRTSSAGRPCVILGACTEIGLLTARALPPRGRGQIQRLEKRLCDRLNWLYTLLYFASNAACPHAGMGNGIALRCYLWWVRRSLVLRILGLPAGLLTYLELFGLPPFTVLLLVLHRLAQRIRRSTFASIAARFIRSGSSCAGGVADNVDRAHLQTLDASCIGEIHEPASSTASSTSTSASRTTTLPPPIIIVSMPHSRSKTSSQADVVGQGKRLSLQFPIQPSNGTSSPGTYSPRSRPSSWVAPSKVLSPESETAPTEMSILAVLAAQERHVLELKEELTKAEADLQTLKGLYARQEATKFRSKERKAAPLQPVNTLIDITDDPEKEDEAGSTISLEKETMERRKAALLANPKSSPQSNSQRKVFSGSRHLRTLSLLSPDKQYAPPFPQPLNLHEDASTPRQLEAAPRSSTSSDHSKQLIDLSSNERYDSAGLPTIQREQLIRAGTQMANDLKKGLFNFIDDIRQATVGDEAVNGDEEAGFTTRDPLIKGNKKFANGRPALNRSASSKKSVSKSGSTGDDFWKEMGLSEPKTSAVHNKKTHTNKPAQTPQKQTQSVVDEEEEWDNWETPNDAYASKTGDAQDSSDESDAASSHGPGSSRTSTRYHSKRHDSKASSLTTVSSTDDAGRDSKRNSIPWPDMAKMSPSNLKRTASHLMKEWEKQLTPPPESRNSNHSHGDYIGRSDSPSLI
ncbi:hypothetical protein HBH56_115080 [Parastagonospora nodorum]|uniref:DUF4048 domain-containing protein n=1 Tax=Phaeosphaeria nodorum (strain SN15 / ATCC MYA-4574 / FGSC 10173) TaxID=321614 RepID=A0A7U2FGT4_PHANO|nr:hypothetical protein HBH56_115080 [Parastagonospora nodorum]QRD05009.1 hypothetical protein JI435_109320 [Parastagonospora nodorum SN15]KAH3928770.1 hypothetical protein HBH54_134070 [Parastagonospora nodorum]KAH3950502.1 hypothetical protein HBH53_074370 [Parastagonospora nodorum]KAH3965845.1 hypothetical protein HBH51_147400 [Parastagonospora nodorum]